jgi:cytochrome c peroxidase
MGTGKTLLALILVLLTTGCGIGEPGGADLQEDQGLLTAKRGGLATVPIPEPSELAGFVRDRRAAIQLGKALFWDMQAGGDGQQACASCHFHAGTDNRVKNTIHPGPGKTFQVRPPMATLARADFPFHRLQDPAQQGSRVLFDTDDVAGSQGVVKKTFSQIIAGAAADVGVSTADPIFQVGGANVRQVTGRNAPTTINAVFNLRNFWDGRANFYFNGVNPFGARDPDARIWVDDGAGLQAAQILLDHASLASQAVGPANNSVEMSFDGRTFPLLGRKMLGLRPLAQQTVHAADGVLGLLARPGAKGLNIAYRDLIKRAFWDRYWRSTARTPQGFTQMEANFSLFWGLAIQLYEATLVSDDSPFDRYQSGNASALTAAQQRGFAVFLNQGRCGQCHIGQELTAATVSSTLTPDAQGQVLERMKMAGGRLALYDRGFYNIGVRPTEEDLGAGGADPFGNPLSLAKQAATGGFVDPLMMPLDPCKFRAGPCQQIARDEPVAVEGAFKTPTLRNVELTGPYMHNGGMATLRQVLEFYNRHGDFRDHNLANFDPDLDFIANPTDVPGPFRFSEQELLDLESFLRSLTDERVRREMAPFDHPELLVPNGPHLSAVGASGGAPIKEFVLGLQ